MPSAQHNHREIVFRDQARFRGIFSTFPELFNMARGRLPAGIEASMNYSDAGMPPESTHVVMEHIVEVLPTTDTEPC